MPVGGKVLNSKYIGKVTLCLIKQNAMKIYEAMDYVAHILHFSNRWCELHTEAALPPERQSPLPSLTGQTQGLILMKWTEKFLPTSVIKIWWPSQLGHNLVTILTELSQLLFVKNHNTKSRTHGHSYFVLVHTDMHAHSLTQINMCLETLNKLHSNCANWNDPAKKQVLLTQQRAH
jgi:hypothetical protein